MLQVFISSLIGAVASAIVASMISIINNKRLSKKKETEEDIAERKAIKEACKLMMRQGLKDYYEYYTNQGYCPLEEKNEVKAEYKIYHDGLNGNNLGTMYYEAIMDLPDSKQ